MMFVLKLSVTDRGLSRDHNATGALEMAWHLRKKRSRISKALRVKKTPRVRKIHPIQPIRPIKPIAPIGYEYYWRD